MSACAEIAAFRAIAPFDELERRYTEPWRYYHVWHHPQAMLSHLDRAIDDGISLIDPVACVGFVLWHDAVYDPQAGHGRNERLSADLCRAEMAPFANRRSVLQACAAILATIGHVPSSSADCPDAPLLLDIDLSILGQSPAAFATYDRQIRAEYAHVDEPAYRSARAGILRSFLQRPRLFLTDWAAAQWERQARANLAVAIERLDSGSPL